MQRSAELGPIPRLEPMPTAATYAASALMDAALAHINANLAHINAPYRRKCCAFLGVWAFGRKAAMSSEG